MPDSAVVIGHGGLGTILRAQAHGVPQLLLPLGRDQAFNAGRVEQLEAGIRLSPDAPPERIRSALQTPLTIRDFEQRPLSPPAALPLTIPTGPPARLSNAPRTTSDRAAAAPALGRGGDSAPLVESDPCATRSSAARPTLLATSARLHAGRRTGMLGRHPASGLPIERARLS
jgi:hypothetical protein